MIELKIQADGYEICEDDLRCILSWKDYSSSIWRIKSLLLRFKESCDEDGKSEQEVIDFYREACVLLSDLPILERESP